MSTERIISSTIPAPSAYKHEDVWKQLPSPNMMGITWKQAYFEEMRGKQGVHEVCIDLAQAIMKIQNLVAGEAKPRWDNSPDTTMTRNYILDICNAILEE